ncbi:mechanosensitive ion channel [Corynebacterium poyangense]|uniref:Mechanosensitive ion channel n=1 Tax=Corynebacterium poyangense TaxID=2684405 RepID=A0A7H0SNH5_9CORY|nr:mechanosensitive ion channel domain-containing protein [Corynebacterium poyangense]MBZ8177130.1 mechanosensitive ion channel [Corynebacterium poyangense]QNQ90100.1 mechanosensitive ion channel [Corynebacterium poyangense]
MSYTQYVLLHIWSWIVNTGLNLFLILVLIFLVPRIGRFVLFWVNRRIENRPTNSPADSTDDKTQLALAGVAVYIGQIIALFILLVLLLQTLGFSLTGAAIPATVASAAIGLGAQSIIADFLAGFFILTEKQFGVGDWVKFEGNGIKAEGTVIQVTMRATQIRTLAEETVIIPNSTARVCINASNHWSRAVVSIPIPLLGSENVQEAISRSERAARRALTKPEVKAELLGDLVVQPAVAITPPTTVGMPWLMTMRFMVQSTAGNHWMIERAIRTCILDEFWDEYGSATTTSGELRTEAMPVSSSDTEIIEAPTTEVIPQQHDLKTKEELEQDPAIQDTSVLNPLDPDKDSASGDHDNKEHRSPARRRQWLTFHGWVRPSTTILLVSLIVLFALKMMSLQTADGIGDGFLAPPPMSSTNTPTPTTHSEPTTTESEAPTSTYPREETQPSYTQEPSREPAPSATATTQRQPAPANTPEPHANQGGGAAETHTGAAAQHKSAEPQTTAPVG